MGERASAAEWTVTGGVTLSGWGCDGLTGRLEDLELNF